MSEDYVYTEDNKSSWFGFIEDYLHNLLKKSDNETKANLSTFEWFIYIGTLLSVLILPFLFSRLTTENFLTPKEFFARIAIGILGGLVCAKLFMGKKITFARTTLDMPLVLFFAFCALSVAWNFNGISAIRDLRGVFAIMLLFPVIVNVFRSRWQVELLLWVVLFTGLATATIGFMESYNFYFKFDVNGIHYVKDDVLATPKRIDPNAFYIPLFPQLASPDYYMGSVVSTFGNRNYLGTYAMFVAFIPLAFFFYYKNVFMKVISLGLFSWLLYGLYSTRCRAALIGLAVGFIYMAIMLVINDKGFKLVKRYRALFFIVIGLFVLGLGVSSVTMSKVNSESMYDKIKLTFTLDRLVSNTYERMWVWFGNNRTFMANPVTTLIGNGFGSFKHFFPLKEGEIFSEDNRETFTAVTFRQAHNDWIQIFSELGIVGMILFLFILKRFFGGIQTALRKDIFAEAEGEMNGDHILTIGLAAAMVSQLFAALPDFPFHRIETAFMALVFMALVPVITETNFFKSPLKTKPIEISPNLRIALVAAAVLGALLNAYHENRCWKADINVRESEMLMTHGANSPEALTRAKRLLLDAINLDSLPGDPYNKLASWYEMVDKDSSTALKYADMSWKNINFNARSTYHSVLYRKMHIYYHLMQNLPMAYNNAIHALNLTAGDARSIYYLYAGKIGADMLRDPSRLSQADIASVTVDTEKYLTKAMDFPQFKYQAMASLAVFEAQYKKWDKAYAHAGEVSRAYGNQDPTMLDIMGVSASNLGRNDIAIQALDAAIKLTPGNLALLRDMGLVYKRMGNKEEAKKYLEDCINRGNCPDSIKVQIQEELKGL